MAEIFLANAIIVIFFIGDFLIRKDKTAVSINKTKDDKNSTKIIIFAFFIIVIASELLEYFQWGEFKNKIISRVALAFMLSGLVIRIYSMSRLKKFYTRTLIITDQQKLVKTGIYKIVRHPGYLGTVMIWIFFGLAIQNLIVFFIALVLILFAYNYRIKVEEKMLLTQFGKEYANYKKLSWKIIPYVY